MDPKEEPLEPEVTVEVIPDTVTEIIYLPDGEAPSGENYYVPSEEELENEETTEYEIGSVDTTRLHNRDLVLDQTETFVFLSADNTIVNSGTVFLQHVNGKDKNRDKSNPDDPGEEDMLLEELFDCPTCSFKASSVEIFEAHLLTHQEPQSCDSCAKAFPTGNLLARHHKEEHTIYTCSVCNIDCTGRKSYASHVRQHDQKKYVCHKCSACFNSGDKLMGHMETHGTVLLYACNKCDAAFGSTFEVSTHLRHVHTKNNRVEHRKAEGVGTGGKLGKKNSIPR